MALLRSLKARGGPSATGTWGARYTIDVSDVLETWQPLITFTNKYGTTQFTDPRATNATQRFYRAELVAP